ncbi:MAG TPA: hypothetical protein VFD73_01665, partial [Gemmatimonadales bacterium]|nr:hypothetical protein [Gemmatimonadales bacterium]
MATIATSLAASENIQAIQLLLEVGAIRTNVVRVTPEMIAPGTLDLIIDQPLVDYLPTSFGRALADYVATDMGAFE